MKETMDWKIPLFKIHWDENDIEMVTDKVYHLIKCDLILEGERRTKALR